MMAWQWQNLLACLGHITLHAQDDSCPCNQVHMGDDGKFHAEYCLGKHLIDFWSLCLETGLMSSAHRDMLESMAVEANEFLEKAKTIYCNGGTWPDLAQWARDCRKKIEPIFYSCEVKGHKPPAPAPPPEPATMTPEDVIEVIIPAPAPVLEVEVVPEIEVIPAPAPCGFCADVPNPGRVIVEPVPAPPSLVAEVCAGLQEGKDTHVHFLGVPPDPKTGDHAWHRKWVDLYSKAQTVVGCGGA